MAGYNPFKKFRDNQKAAMAILAVLAMVSFIVLPTVLQLMGTGGGPREKTVIATSPKYGTVTQQSLENLGYRHETLSRFFTNLWYMAANGTAWERVDETLIPPELVPLHRVVGAYRGRTPEGLIQKWLLTRYAADQGVTITDEMVLDYLDELVMGQLTNEVLGNALTSSDMNKRQLLVLLKEELLAARMEMMFRFSSSAATPAKRWDWFQRLQRKVSVEVAAVNVADFTEQVQPPSEAALKEFFEANKLRTFDPSKPESGFYLPRRIKLQYFAAEPTEEMLATVPMEEIQKYYEENKGTRFLRPIRQTPSGMPDILSPGFGTGMRRGPAFPGPTLPGMDGSSPVSTPFLPTDTPGQTPLPSSFEWPEPTTPDLLTPSAPSAPGTTELPPMQETPESPAEEPSDQQPDAQPAGEQPAEEKPAEEQPAATEDAAPATEPTTENISNTVFRRVVFQEAQEQPAEEKPAEEKPAEEKPAEEKPAEEKPAEEEPLDLSVLYRPLEEVEQEIRLILAQQKLDEKIAEAEKEMRAYFSAYYSAVESDKEKPQPLDMSALAGKYGFQLVDATEKPITVHDAMKLSLARDDEGLMFIRQIFEQGWNEYEPMILGSRTRFLLWVTEESRERQPEYDEVRDVVLARWKEVQARKDALAKAEQLAEQAKTANAPLGTVFAADSSVQTVETEPFSWIDVEIQRMPGSLVPNVLFHTGIVCEKGLTERDALVSNTIIFAPGTEFMETAYGLDIGQVGVAFNESRSTAYVIRLLSSTPSEETLLDLFRTMPFQYYERVGLEDQQRARSEWIANIEKEVGFVWKYRPTDFWQRSE